MEATLATAPTETGDSAEVGADDAGGSRRRLSRHPLVWLGLAMAVWAVVVTVYLVGAATAARDGMRTLEAVRDDAPASSLGSSRSTAQLHQAEGYFGTARARVRSLPVSPLRALPVIGRQLRSADHLSGAAAEVAGTAADALDQVQAELEGGFPPGPERARLFSRLAEVAGKAENRLAGVDLGPDDALVSPLADARSRATEELGMLRGSAGRARAATLAMAEVLAGDSTHLLLLGNNAEMRAGSGTFLTVATLVVSDGLLSVGEIVPTFDFQLPESVPLDGDLADRWGWLEPGREWRNLAVSPRFDVTGPQAARMWAAARGQEVDGVLAMDVVALQAMLTAVGPIEVDGQRIGADTVLEDLFHDQYVGVVDEVAQAELQAERRERLGGVARATLEALERPGIDIAVLAEELAAAARGRHVLAWSPDDSVQRGWEAMDLDGAVGPDDLLVAVVNRGGNKLDPYLEVEADLSVVSGSEVTAVSVELRLANRASPDAPAYVLGPAPTLQVPPGTYVGLVAVTLPGAAGAARFDGVEALPVAGADGPTRVVAVPITIPRGGEHVVTLRFELPPGPGAIQVLPSARVPPVSWRWRDGAWKDDHTEVVAW